MGPLPPIALAFTAGIALGLAWPAPQLSPLLVLCGSAIAVGLAIRCGKHLALAATMVALASGWARVPERNRPSELAPDEETCPRLVQGRAVSAPVSIDRRTRMRIQIEGRSGCLAGRGRPRLLPHDGTLFLTTMEELPPPVDRGDRIRLITTARPIRAHVNPPRAAPRPWAGQWSAAVDRADSAARIGARGGGLLTAFDVLRSDLAGFWDENLGPEQARLARALTLGEAAILDPAQKERFRRTGTAHLLAVSGLHLGLVVLFVFGIARFALVRTYRLSARVEVSRLAALAAIPLAVGFALLAGGRPPVVRACAMAVCALLGRALGRRASVTEAIALAGVGLLAWDPEELLRPGFQLSFAAVLGFVLVFGRPANRVDYTAADDGAARSRLATLLERAGRFVLRVLKASAAATAATSPLVLWHFERLSLIGLPVNALAVPVAGFAIMPGLLAVTALAGPLPDLAALVARPIGWALEALDSCLAALADLPCTLESPGPIATLATCAVCLAALIALARWYRPALLVGGCALLLVALSVPLDAPRFPRGNLTVDFLDVGQGDATLLTFPDGSHWLVDAAGNPDGAHDVGEHLVVPVLRALGVRRLDTLVLTHPDPDHVGGMPAVVSNLDVGRIWDNGQGKAEGAVEQYGELLHLAARQGVPIERTRSICGSHAVGQVEIDVLHPCHDEVGYDPGLSFNDNSLVLALAFGRVSLLLPGDLSREGEEVLLSRGAIPRVEVLKLGHHGSASSSHPAFLDATAPLSAIASSGAWNRFGLPHASLLDRLKRREIHVHRTDRHGAIRLATDGESYSLTRRRSQ
jgi:competence protein ComEC